MLVLVNLLMVMIVSLETRSAQCIGDLLKVLAGLFSLCLFLIFGMAYLLGIFKELRMRLKFSDRGNMALGGVN
jgi:hypothetical protein